MASPGPARKPTVLRILEGNPSGRPLPSAEPKPKRLKRVMTPPGMSAEAEAEWKRIAKALNNLGLLTELDIDALVNYCETLGIWIRSRRQVIAHGDIIWTRDKHGDPLPRPNPYLIQMKHAARELRLWASEFGFTPGGRARLSVPGADEGADEYF